MRSTPQSSEALGGDPDPADPRSWAALRSAAIQGLLENDNRAAIRWLQYVERHRSREVAEQSRERLRRAVEWHRQQALKEAERRAKRPAPNPRPASPFGQMMRKAA